MAHVAYISFDVVPAPKGAATHIEAFARALAPVELVTVAAGSDPEARIERWPGVFHTALPALGASAIDRVLCFRRYLARWLASRRFDAIQFRSSFEGMPLTALRPVPHLVFEVNGLPSIELKYRYPRAADDRELLAKLIAQERACLRAATLIVTPSSVTRRFLAAERGADPAKIRVIPNGVDTTTFAGRRNRLPHLTADRCPSWVGQAVSPAHQPADSLRLLYFGTLTPWQGVGLAVRALAMVNAQTPATLTVIGAAGRRQTDGLAALASKLSVGAQLRILPGIPQSELVQHLHQADVVLAPLTINDRNTVQGCCPLKILESMAAGVPVIASDLEVVRELGRHEEHLLLFKPGSVDQIAAAALRLYNEPQFAAALTERAREHVLANFTWDGAATALRAAYREFGINLSSTAAS